MRERRNDVRQGLRALALALLLCAFAAPAAAQRATPGGRTPAGAPGATDPKTGEALVQLDFKDAELAEVIETIAKMTNRNFIYDDRVRGRVTIISPTSIPLEQAYAVFESVLQVKGFTTVETPGGALKVIPVRDAKESSVETLRSGLLPPNRDLFVTRLIPLRYVDAEPIVNTLKPLVSKDAAIAAYVPTNTVILTESASNIRRILAILEAIDIDTYSEELTVIALEHADADTLAQQISDIFSDDAAPAGRRTSQGSRRSTGRRTPAAQTSAGGAKPGGVRILTDQRTNSIIVLAARSEIDEVRALVRRLDVPVLGGGRIHVHYLQHADAEELAQTLGSLVGGRPAAPGGGGGGAEGQAQAIRAAVTGLAGGVSITADPATNALVIQASREGYDTIAAVIDQLDVERPQVLVEALIMEVQVTDAQDLGFSGVFRLVTDDLQLTVETISDAATRGALSGLGIPVPPALGSGTGPIGDVGRNFLGGFSSSNAQGTSIQGIIRASAQDAGTNIISAPHILTSDNEEAEIRIGNNIPIISSRVQSAAGQDIGLSTSVNVERQDIGVTLRVTPQITEGESLRLDIFQELTDVNEALSFVTGPPEEVGVSLLNRRIENTVVVEDGETVVIGGLISDVYTDTVQKIPWLGDIPIIGWMFKTTSRELRKVNLIVFLTPHVIRTSEDLEYTTVRKRHEFREKTGAQITEVSREDREIESQRLADARAACAPYEAPPSNNPVNDVLIEHESRYPLQRMCEIEQLRDDRREQERLERESGRRAPQYVVQAPVSGGETEATDLLMELIDAGYDGTLVSTQAGSAVLFEIRIGPYESIDEAQRAGAVVESSHGLIPSVMVLGSGREGP